MSKPKVGKQTLSYTQVTSSPKRVANLIDYKISQNPESFLNFAVSGVALYGGYSLEDLENRWRSLKTTENPKDLECAIFSVFVDKEKSKLFSSYGELLKYQQDTKDKIGIIQVLTLTHKENAQNCTSLLAEILTYRHHDVRCFVK
jgi:hypothetical protein